MMAYPSRRIFLTNLATAAIGPAILGRRAFAQSLPARVDPAALRQRLEALSLFGRPAGGTFADGVSRVAYSDADIAGRTYVIGLMRAAGPRSAHRSRRQHLRAPRRPRAEAAADPVRLAHRLGAERRQLRRRPRLARARSARSRPARAGIRTRHPLEMVVWCAEEGVAFGRGLAGSRIVAGDITPANGSGLERHEARRRDPQIGGDPDRIDEAVRPKGVASLLPRAAHRAGRHARTQIPPDRRRRRHRRDRPLRRGHHRLGQSRRHDADGRAAGCDGRGGAADARGARDRHARARAVRSAPSVSSTSSRTRRT